jgi:hypothetical protein
MVPTSTRGRAFTKKVTAEDYIMSGKAGRNVFPQYFSPVTLKKVNSGMSLKSGNSSFAVHQELNPMLI